VDLHIFAFKPASGLDPSQLVHGDGRNADLPELDHVVRLAVEYFGEPAPPLLASAAGSGSTGRPRVTYGPSPPGVGADDAGDTWPPGENCTFAVQGGAHLARLPPLAVSPGLVRLARSLLEDGPWCPDASAANRFDADVLRIRQVRVRLVVEAAAPDTRGRQGPWFVNAGTSRGGPMFVPDREVVFDVVPRSVAAGR